MLVESNICFVKEEELAGGIILMLDRLKNWI